ncbi:unnamed protein product, partial [Pocillopora meandrina]
LIKTLVDRAYKINNTWLRFHEDINNLIDILKKNLFPAHLIEKIINQHLVSDRASHIFKHLKDSPVVFNR